MRAKRAFQTRSESRISSTAKSILEIHQIVLALSFDNRDSVTRLDPKPLDYAKSSNDRMAGLYHCLAVGCVLFTIIQYQIIGINQTLIRILQHIEDRAKNQGGKNT
jgi:hypothetical protein